MPYLVLIRHSISIQQPGVSAHTWVLSQEGLEKCHALADQLRGLNITHLHTSDEPKAAQTAQAVADHLGGLPVTLNAALRETHRESAPYFADPADFQAAIHTAMATPQAVLFGEEAFADAEARFAVALENILKTHPHQSVAAVTHGTVMALHMARLTGLDPFWLWQQQAMPAFAVFALPQMRLCQICFDLPKP
jgi:broad specificity phosphatase PhoE